MKMVMLSSLQESPAWPDDQMYALAAEDFRRIQAHLPTNILLLAAPVNNWMPDIDPVEQEIVQHAVLSRQAEYSTGRMLAARALMEMSTPVSAILRGPMNEPIWPVGIVGSITHTNDICLVAVATTKHMVGVGIDIEANRPEFDNLAHLILRPDERQATGIKFLPKKDVVRLIFGAKEALYKAIYGRANRFVDFQEVRIEFGPEAGRFTANAPNDQDLNALIRDGTGRYLFAENILFTIWLQES